MSKIETLEEMIRELVKVDVLCLREGIQAHLMILGGSGLLLIMEMMDMKFRPTDDIDVNIMASNNEAGIRKILNNAFIDILDGTVEVPPMEDFRDHPHIKVETELLKAIEIFVPTIELLACTKIFSRRGKDYDDLMYTDILNACDKEVLMEKVDEYKDFLVNPNDPDLNYYQLQNIMRERGI